MGQEQEDASALSWRERQAAPALCWSCGMMEPLKPSPGQGAEGRGVFWEDEPVHSLLSSEVLSEHVVLFHGGMAKGAPRSQDLPNIHPLLHLELGSLLRRLFSQSSPIQHNLQILISAA